MMSPREILEEVKRRITEDPGSYSQQSFCGTPCCIAGHIDCVVSGNDAHAERNRLWLADRDWNNTHGAVNLIAARAIGTTMDDWLFNGVNEEICDFEETYEDDTDYWPLELCLEYNNAANATERAIVGCKAIDTYIAEKGL